MKRYANEVSVSIDGSNFSIGRGTDYPLPTIGYPYTKEYTISLTPGTKVFNFLDSFGDGWDGGGYWILLDSSGAEIDTGIPVRSGRAETIVIPATTGV